MIPSTLYALYALYALLNGPSCQVRASESTIFAMSCFFQAVLEQLKAAGWSFFWATWEFLKACRHSLDEQCFAIEEQAEVTQFILSECPETVTIEAIGLVVPRWVHEWAYLVLIATVWGVFFWLRVEIGHVMLGRRQEVINAVNAVNEVGVGDPDR